MTAVAPTRERLLDAARALIEDGGYGGASVAAVAERAGVATGTLYRHFSSKEDLFVDLFRTVCDREMEAMRAAAARDGLTATERIASVLETFAERALRRPRLAWALLAEPVAEGVDAERLAYRARYRELIAAQLRNAIAAGEIPAQDAELTSAALVGACAEAVVGPLAAGSAAAGPLGVDPLAAGSVAAGPPAGGLAVASIRTFALRAIGANA